MLFEYEHEYRVAVYEKVWPILFPLKLLNGILEILILVLRELLWLKNGLLDFSYSYSYSMKWYSYSKGSIRI